MNKSEERITDERTENDLESRTRMSPTLALNHKTLEPRTAGLKRRP